MAKTDHVGAVVVGAGIVGLTSAFHLVERGVGPIVVIEESDSPGQGSSKGSSRVAGFALTNEVEVRLFRQAHFQDWPQLERRIRQKIRFPCPSVLFGADIGNFADTVREAGGEFECLTPEAARAEFPVFSFQNTDEVVLEGHSSLLAADLVVESLSRWLKVKGVTLALGTRVEALSSVSPVLLETSRGQLSCDHLVLAAGAHTSQLFPELEQHLFSQRLPVFEFEILSDHGTRLGEDCPIWTHFGWEQGLVYGLPGRGRDGMKIVLCPEGETELDLPTYGEMIRTFLEGESALRLGSITDSHWCTVTYSSSSKFVLANHPENPKVSIGAGFCGRGFKFAPSLGRRLAELCTLPVEETSTFLGFPDPFSLEEYQNE